MKKIYTYTLLLFAMASAVSQTFYSENFGTTATSNPYPAASDFTGFQNGDLTGIDYSGTADVRATLPSTGYTGASAVNNVFFTNTVGRFLLIEGINTSPYSTADLTLSFGQNQFSTSATPDANLVVEVSTDGTNWTPLNYTRTSATGWELISIGNSSIPSATNLRIRFTQNSTIQYRIDDVKITALSSSCLLSLGEETTACDAVTPAFDTFTITIPFTGGGTATYGVVTSHGTLSGDNPSTTASGNIIIEGIAENLSGDVTVTVTGGTCSFTRIISPASCKPINELPFSESFPYSPATLLGNQQKWRELNSGDSVILFTGSLNYTGLTTTGNSAAFGGSGAEAWAPFTETTTGMVYASFLISVADMSNVTVDGTEAYIAAFTESNGDYLARFWLKKNGTQYNVGISFGPNGATYTTEAFDIDETVYVVMGFDYATNTYSAWINPTVAGFDGSQTATLTDTATTAPENFGGFILRQDSNTETPAAIIFDELRIGTMVEDVVLSVRNNEIAEFKMFPNPVNGNVLTITSASAAEKTVLIYDLTGKEVVNTVTSAGTITLPGLTTGMYMVKITEDGKTATRKLIVQ